MSTEIKRVAILGGNRIPFARSGTVYTQCSNHEMLAAAINGLVHRYELQNKTIDEVVAGAVMKHSRDFNLTREAMLSTDLAPQTPCYDIQQACATGLEAAILVANKIALGQIDVGIAGGTDTTSDAPIAVNDDLRKILLEINRAKTAGDRLKAAAKIRPKHIVPEIPVNGEPRTGLSMGEHCQITAKQWQIPREEQDILTVASHQNLAKAYDEGFFDDLISPFNGVDRDQLLRTDTSLKKLSRLKPCFDKSKGADAMAGTMTAANSTALTDGASAVLLASEEWAKANNIPVLAYLSFSQSAAVDFIKPVDGDVADGLLMAPAFAVPILLAKTGLSLQDFDYYEIHEAFAAQVLSTLAAWNNQDFCKNRLGLSTVLGEIDRSKLNVKGGSLATGHPFAATGGRILATLAKTIDQNGGGRGLISVCAAGGIGVVAIVEK